MKNIYARLSFLLIAVLSFIKVEAQQVVNAGPDITLPCGVSCTNLSATILGQGTGCDYTVTNPPYNPYLPFSAGTNLFTGTFVDDYWSSQITIPFTFSFYCNNYTSLWVSTNGYATFTPQTAGGFSVYANYAIPSCNVPSNTIFGYFRDLVATTASPTYTTVGTAPNRKFIINYNNVNIYYSSPYATFQIVLYETTNVIEIYLEHTISGNATVGIQAACGSCALPAATNRNGTSFVVNQEAWRFTPTNTTVAPTVTLSTIGGTVLSTTTATTVGSNFAATFNNICLGTGVDSAEYVISVPFTSCGNTVTYKDTVKVIRTTTPPPTVTTPVNYCQNATSVPLTANGTNLLWYTVPTGGTGSSTAPTPSTTTVGTFTWYVSQTVNGCESSRVPITVNILQVPVVTAGSNSPLCAGNTLLLTATPNYTGANFYWTGPGTYTSGFQNPSIGFAQPNNAGTYCVYAILGGCQSATSCTNVVITPAPVITSVNFTNVTNCNNLNGTITLNGLTANTSYTVNYTKNGTPQAPLTITSNGSGQVVMTGLGAGTYTSISVSISGCTSNSVGPVTITQPSAPTITETHVNPTTCNGTNGSITISGLTNGTSYTVNYTKNGTPQPPLTLTATGGSVTITGLTAGTYTAISVTTVTTNCTSNTLGPVTLVDPNAPSVTLASTNPTVCNSSTGTITLSGLTNGSSYTINYTLNGTPQAPVTQTASGGAVTLTGLAAGTYTAISVTINGCTSNVVSATLVDPSGPAINVTPNNPTACNTNTGSLVLSPLVNGQTYSVYYTQNGTPQGPVSMTASGGNITISSLPSGTYTNIYVIINSCSSNTLGPVSLTDPSAPATPTAGSNSPVCAGQALNLTSSSTTAGVTYNWTGPVNFPNTQNPTITTSQVSNTGTYSVTATLNGCTSAAATVNVVVNASPAGVVAASNSPVCEGNNLNFTATSTTAGVTWSWTGPGFGGPNTNQNPTISNASPAASGTYTLTATANGCSTTATTAVNIITKPTIAATSANPTVCGGTNGTITLSGLTTGTGYVVNYDKNGTPQAPQNLTATGGTVTISGLSAGTYTNITASLNGCPSNIIGPITLTDPTVPPTPTAGSNSPLCEGDDLNLTATTVTGATYTWTGPGFTGPNTNQNPTIANAAPTASGTYNVTATVNGCTSLPGTVNVIVNPAPGNPNAGSNSPICEGSTLNLTSNAISGVSYSWSGPGFSGNNQNETINNATPAATGMYMLVVDNGSCADTGYVNVTVNPIPLAPTVVSPVEVCEFGQLALTAQGQNLLWYDVAVGGTGYPTQNAYTGTAGSTMYYVSQTVNGCEGPRAPLQVIVKPQPVPPVVTPAYTYCQYDTGVVTLTATGQNIQWYDVAMGGSPLGAAPTPNTTVPGTYLWYATQTDNGCESQRSPVMVTVHPQPQLPAVAEVVYCQDDEPQPLTAQGNNLLWYAAATGGTGDPNAPTPSTGAVGTTDYYVSQSDNGCESDRALVQVTVNPKVTAEILTDKDTVCDSYPLAVSFGGQAPTTAVYDWNFNGADVTGSGAGPYTASWSDPGIKTISLTVSNLNCSASASREVVVLPTPDPHFSIQADACINEQVRVQSDYDQMGMPGYSWDFGGAQIIEGSGYGPYTLQWNSTGQKVIKMSLTNIPCPSLPYADTINIHHPTAKIMDISSDRVCSADSVLFTAEGGLDYSYRWGPDRYFSQEPTGMSAWGVIQKSSYVTLEVSDRWGCKNMDSMLVETESCCQVYLPNAFSPNGDGRNDVFRLVTKGNQTISRFIIMDRWGRKVFETADPNEAWDGTFNGEPQDIGTYSYYLKYRCGEAKEISEQQGDVTLIR